MNGECIPYLVALGISMDDARALRRIAMTLHRWHELECGTDDGHIERDREDKPWFVPWFVRQTSTNRYGSTKWRVNDRENAAKRRLGRIMGAYPALHPYIQTDPRGVALYIVPASALPAGAGLDDLDMHYNRGVAVYK